MARGTSPTLTLERLRAEGDQLMEALSREYYLALAGHKGSADLQAVYARHEAIISDDALQMVREWYLGAENGSEEQRAARMILEWQAELQAGRRLAALEEHEIAWEASARLPLPDGSDIEFQRSTIEIANRENRADRLAIDGARNALIAKELAPLRELRLSRDREITASLELADGTIPTFELLTGISLTALRAQCEAFLRDTQPMWDDLFTAVVKRQLGINPADAQRSDGVRLFRGQQFDRYFPPGAMQDAVLGQVREMGIDPLAAGRITLDADDRPGKRARAFCAPVRVPDEVYLVIRPHGGQADWMTFLHELGHALHYAYARPSLPFEYRWLGDNSITESYAMLFDHLTKNTRWLKRYSELGKTHLARFAHSAAFDELHMLRRYSAKLIYEMHLWGGEVSWREIPDLYADQLTKATRFRYDRANAFVDVDARFYAARYLRAWQLQALLAESLTERYDEDWWRNPEAGPWVIEELFAEGQREEGSALARRVSGKALEFGQLIRGIEKML
jgi:hypothetical protein